MFVWQGGDAYIAVNRIEGVFGSGDKAPRTNGSNSTANSKGQKVELVPDAVLLFW